MERERWWGDEGTHAVLADLTGAMAKVWHPSALGVVADVYMPGYGRLPLYCVDVAVSADEHC
eukprot:7171534-Prymnesium_polylepis.1